MGGDSRGPVPLLAALQRRDLLRYGRGLQGWRRPHVRRPPRGCGPLDPCGHSHARRPTLANAVARALPTLNGLRPHLEHAEQGLQALAASSGGARGVRASAPQGTVKQLRLLRLERCVCAHPRVRPRLTPRRTPRARAIAAFIIFSRGTFALVRIFSYTFLVSRVKMNLC